MAHSAQTVLVVLLLSADFWTVRVRALQSTKWLSSQAPTERQWTRTRRLAVLEPGRRRWVEVRSPPLFMAASEIVRDAQLLGIRIEGSVTTCQCSRLKVRVALGLAAPFDADTPPHRMFWMAMYTVRYRSCCSSVSRERITTHAQFPAAWIVLFFVGLLKFNVSCAHSFFRSLACPLVEAAYRFLPIVALALVFNVTNAIGAFSPPISSTPVRPTYATHSLQLRRSRCEETLGDGYGDSRHARWRPRRRRLFDRRRPGEGSGREIVELKDDDDPCIPSMYKKEKRRSGYMRRRTAIRQDPLSC